MCTISSGWHLLCCGQLSCSFSGISNWVKLYGFQWVRVCIITSHWWSCPTIYLSIYAEPRQWLRGVIVLRLYFYPTPRSIALILDVNSWMSEWVCFLLLKWALHINYYWCSACCNVGPIDAYRIYDVEGGHVQSYSPTWRQLISILAAHISEGHCRYVTPDTCAIVAINMCIARVLRYPFAPNHTIIYVYMSPFHVHHTHI